MVFSNKNCLSLKFGKENILNYGLLKLPACYIFTINLYIEPDIRYLAFKLAGYPAKSGIQCIPKCHNLISYGTHVEIYRRTIGTLL
jgi:hypothetical protein